MIHALDPVFVVEKIACSRIDTIVPIEEVIEQTVTGIKLSLFNMAAGNIKITRMACVTFLWTVLV